VATCRQLPYLRPVPSSTKPAILIMTSFAQLVPTVLTTRNPCLSPIAISPAVTKPAILIVTSFSLWRHWRHPQRYRIMNVQTPYCVWFIEIETNGFEMPSEWVQGLGWLKRVVHRCVTANLDELFDVRTLINSFVTVVTERPGSVITDTWVVAVGRVWDTAVTAWNQYERCGEWTGD